VKTVTAAIDINAAPERVWQVLTDLNGHADWDPFITHAAGDIAVGGKISVTIEPPGRKPITFKPTITQVKHNRELAWLGHVVMPGIFDGAHRFTLEPHGDGTRLRQTEAFSGVLVWFSRGLLANTERGFTASNEALKQRVEQN
jgi:hypothetical protein